MNAILEQINSAGSTFVEFAGPMLVQSSALIIILLLLDLVLRKKLRAVFRYWIWMLVLVKMILPTTLATPLSVGNWFGDELATIKVSDTAVEQNPADAPQAAETAFSGVSNEALMAIPARPTVESAAYQELVTWEGVVFLVWLAVAAAMVLLLLQRAIFVKGLVAQAKSANALMNDTLDFCCTKMGVKGKVGLKVSPNATSPAVCGLFRPVILVPQDLGANLGAGGLRTVLMHELAHIKRADLWVNLAQTLLQIVYFYNPLLWLANWVIRRVREQAVDETVLVAMGEKAQQYPETLVNVAKLAFKRPALSLRLIGVVESKSALQGRIKHILERPIPKSAKLGAAGLLSIVIAGAVLLPMARAKDSGQRIADGGQKTTEKSEFTATLANGVTVELVGVFEFSEGKVQNCWEPDGTKLDEQLQINYGSDYKYKAFAFVFNTDKAAEITRCDVEGAIDRLGTARVIDANGQITGLAKSRQQHVKLVRIEGREATDIRISIAPQWIRKTNYDGRYVVGKHDPKIKFIESYETGGGVKVVFQNEYEGYESRLKAVLSREGIKRNGYRMNVNRMNVNGRLNTVYSKEGEKQTAGLFENLKLSDIRYFELYIRRKPEWVVFKNVSLKPDFKTDVQVEVQSAGKKKQPAETVGSGGAGGAAMGCTDKCEDKNGRESCEDESGH